MSDALVWNEPPRFLPGDICVNCRERPATTDWVGEMGALAFNRGMSSRWCDVCTFTAQLAYAKERAAAIPELERQLARSLAER